jgi:GNAT superfamily N-acetyltransferase
MGRDLSSRGPQVSRIVPFLSIGAGVTLTRGDIHYVVTEYGIAYLHGKSIRERAMDLITIAHPNFRHWLIEEARRLHLIYPDQAFIPGIKGEYPADLEVLKTTTKGLQLLLRPIKISDEPMLKDFFYSLSHESMYQRFISARRDIPHELLQEFVVVDYFQKMILVAVIQEGDRESICGLGQYGLNSDTYTADVALVVRDDCQKKGVAGELLSYLTYLAKRQGILGFTAMIQSSGSSRKWDLMLARGARKVFMRCWPCSDEKDGISPVGESSSPVFPFVGHKEDVVIGMCEVNELHVPLPVLLEHKDRLLASQPGERIPVALDVGAEQIDFPQDLISPPGVHHAGVELLHLGCQDVREI